jgi:HAD superfamily hydrolase (TIGR01490 family)
MAEKHHSGMAARGKASFFDVDNTLIRGDTQEMEGRYLMAGGATSPGRLAVFAGILGAVALHRLGVVSLIRQNAAYCRLYRGWTRTELDALGRRLFERQVRTRILDRAAALLETRRQQGDLIVLVSATTRHLIAPFEPVFRPDAVFCTDLEFDGQERATGRVAGRICAQGEKAEQVRAFAHDHQLDLAACRAYSDHHLDLPFLECVGRPEAVNPTPGLAAVARRRGWPIHWCFG